MSLSVVLATYNEEKNLSECLDSVKELADEIVVVDGSSTDKTVEIAKRYGARVKITTNKPIFHVNKQMAIDMATKDWVLQLDADERVTPELAKEIKLEVRSEKLEVNGYWLPRKNWFLGRFLMKGGIYPDYTLRLYRRGKGRLPQKTVHEQTVVDGKVGYLKNPLIHMADPTFGRYLVRWNRYVNLMRDELQRKRPGFFVLFDYLFIKPIWWFLLTYFRHKGFMDSWQGFIFSFFSSLRFPVAYLKYLSQTIKIIFFLLLILATFFVVNKSYAQEYVLPYPGFMPGHPFYQISKLIDRLEERWSFGSFAQFKYHLSMVDKKLVEAKILFEYKQYLLASQALSSYEYYLTQASFYLKQAEKEHKDVLEKKRLLKNAISSHKELLERLNKDLPVSFLWQPEKDESKKIEIREILNKAIRLGEELNTK